jgi:protein-tyrosine phosphatase
MSPLCQAREIIHTNYGTHRGLIRLLLAHAEFAMGRVNQFCDRDLSGAQRLVFVCQGNINRSCFAEQLVRLHRARTLSFGLSTSPGAPAFQKAVSLAPLFGVDLTGHSAIGIDAYNYQEGDFLFCMEIRHARALVARGLPAGKVRLLGRWATPMRIHIHDPLTLADSYFLTCFTTIHSAVMNLMADLRSTMSVAVVPDP